MRCRNALKVEERAQQPRGVASTCEPDPGGLHVLPLITEFFQSQAMELEQSSSFMGSSNVGSLKNASARLANSHPLVSVVIVNYNGSGFIGRCVESVLRSDFPKLEIIVVDNASTDGSIGELEKFKLEKRGLILVKNPVNYGFARASNIGVHLSRGDYILFLNNDTMVKSDCIQEFTKVMQSAEDIGAIQCKLLTMDDPSVIDNVGHFMDLLGMTYEIGSLEEDHGQYDRITELFGARGAAMVVKRPVLFKTGLFDEDFFMYFEETDLCWRIWLNGYKVVLVPEAVVYHKMALASRTMPDPVKNYFFCRNRVTSIIKNYELKNLLLYLPPHLLILSSLALLNMIEGRRQLGLSILKGIVNPLLSKRAIAKRLTVQNRRATSDSFLIRRRILRTPSITQMIRRYSKLTR